MKAMLWKELRENLRWAALGSLGLILAEFYALALQRSHYAGQDSNITVSEPTFLLVVLFGTAVVGAGLAALQILPERSRDRWAALLHRPVPRGVIFGGKATAGLGLYAAAAGLPFLACVAYAAWPGTFAAPFDVGLLWPGLHTLAGGAACYAGSLLVCLHRGRWFGRRGVLLLAVGAVFLLQQSFRGVFLLLPLVATFVFLLAAWGTMLGEGAGTRWPRGGRLAFVAVVALGAQCALLLLGAGLNLLPIKITHLFEPYTRFEVTLDGQVFRRSYSPEGESASLTDLAGKPVTDERYLGSDSYRRFCRFWPLFYDFSLTRRGYAFVDRSRLSGYAFVQPVYLGSESPESWYLLVDRNYFVGYDNASRRYIGCCDRDGFKGPEAKPVPFEWPVKGDRTFRNGIDWVWVGRQLYSIRFLDRQRTLFAVLPDDSTKGVSPVFSGNGDENFHYVAVALADEMRLFDPQGKLVFARPYPHDPHVWSMALVATGSAADRLYVQSQGGYYDDLGKRPVAHYFDELDLHGSPPRSYSEPPLKNPVTEPRWLTMTQTALLPLVPTLLTGWYLHRVPRTLFHEPFAFEQRIRNLAFADWFGLALFALVLALAGFWWARRVGFPVRQAWGWTALIFACGPAGLLAFRLAAPWPEQVRCPVCGHRRGIDQSECPHCHQAWTAPTPSGTEILQPLAG